MKKWMSWILILIVSGSMIGCEKNTDGMIKQEKKYYTFDPAVTWELIPLVSENGEALMDRGNAYRPLDYSITENEIVWLCDRSEEDENGFSVATYVYTETFGLDGNSQGVIEHPLERKHAIPKFYTAWEILPDGGYLLIEAVSVGFNKQEIRMVKYDNAGTVLAECPLPYGMMPALAVCENCYAVSLANEILMFDTNLKNIHKMPYSGEMNELFFCTDGTLYGQNWQGKIVRVDFETQTTTEVLPDDRITGFTQLFTDGDPFLYSADKTGVYAYTELGVEGEQILDWDSSCMIYENTEILQVINENLFLVLSADNLELEKRYALLRRREGTEEIRREHITVLMPDSGKRLNAAELAAVQFNRTNERYYVTLEKAEGSFEETVFTLLQSRKPPDMVLFDTRQEEVYLNLEKQGYLAELSDYGFFDVLTGSTAAAISRGDAMYRVPYTVQYDTLIRSDRQETVTSEELVKRSAAGEVLFSDQYMLPNHFLTCMQSLFIDSEENVCSFDSEAFRQYLSFYQKLADCTDEEAGTLDISNYDGRKSTYMLSDAGLPEKLYSGEIPFFLLPVATLDAFAYTDMLYNTVPHTICGFPEVPLLVSHMDSAAVLDSSGSKDGAAAFLAYLLSDTVQTTTLITNSYVPVTASAVEKELAYSYRYCKITSLQALETTWKSTEPIVLDVFEKKEYKEIVFTEKEQKRILSLLEDERAGRIADPTVDRILLEEIGTYLSGDRTMEDTIRVLQSRVGTYLAE